MKTVGLTGGIACGKSTVAQLLTQRGIPVIDADQVARQVVEPGSEALTEIAARFGAHMVQADGSLDRAALRRVVMADKAARQDLEAITHPRIFAAMGEQLSGLAQQGADVAVVEAALMVETGSYRLYDALLVVSADPDVQIRRVMARDGVDAASAKQVLAAQLPLADKEAVATEVIRNDADLAALEAETARAWSAVLAHLEG